MLAGVVISTLGPDSTDPALSQPELSWQVSVQQLFTNDDPEKPAEQRHFHYGIVAAKGPCEQVGNT